jgi:hypothetical protein
MFTNLIKEACKNTKNCKCCLNSPPFKLQQMNNIASQLPTNMAASQPQKVQVQAQTQRIRPFFMS